MQSVVHHTNYGIFVAGEVVGGKRNALISIVKYTISKVQRYIYLNALLRFRKIWHWMHDSLLVAGAPPPIPDYFVEDM